MRQVLLLNSSYEPLNVCSWRRAVVLMVKGKAVALEVEQQQNLGSGINLPLVIRLLYYVKIPHKDIPLTRRNVMHRDHYMCQYCGKKSDLTIDHVIPRSKGGQDRWDNVVVACLKCNVGKGSKSVKEAGLTLKNKPVRPQYFMHFELSKHRNRALRTDERWQKYLFF